MKKRFAAGVALLITMVMASFSAMAQSVAQPPSPEPQIVFSSQTLGTTNIHIMNPDGSNVRVLENSDQENLHPACSPDGTRIAFTNVFIGARRIDVMNADGSNRVTITDDLSFSNNPTWSSDGTKLAFTANGEETIVSEGSEIYVMNADGSNLTRLIDNEDVESDPAWSPDGTWIAFVSTLPLGGGKLNSEIFLMNPDGSNVTRITNTLASDRYPAWSPDGSKIAFSSNRDGNDELYVMNADGSNVIRLTNNSGYDADPAWSPDGSQIAFVSDRHGNGKVAIYKMNTDGSNVQLLTDTSVNSWEPCWLGVSTPPTITPTVTITSTPFEPSESDLLRTLLSAPTCQRTCFLGIEPGVTTEQEFLDILEANNFPYSVLIMEGGNGTYEFTITTPLPFIPQRSQVVSVQFGSGIVQQLNVPLEVHISVVLEAYGSPDAGGQGDVIYVIEYADEGLSFVTFWEDPIIYGVTLSKTIAPLMPDGRRSAFYASTPIIQECFIFGTAPCIAPTTTPHVTPSPPVSSESDLLRTLLSAPTCQRACFLGIEPGVTSKSEFLSILADNNFPYTLLIEGGGNSDYEFTITTTLPFISQRSQIISVQLDSNGVRQISIPLEVPISVVIEAYGSPDAIGFDSLYRMEYAEEALSFVTSWEKLFFHGVTLSTTVAPIMPDGRRSTFYASTPIIQECFIFGTAPCIAPTTTPHITPSPPVSSEGDLLRRLFTGDKCQLPCFLGIEPGVTTKSQLETRLVAENLPFVFDTWDEPGKGVFNWIPAPHAFRTATFGIIASVENDIIIHISAPLSAPVTAVEEVFGAPDRVVHDEPVTYLIYADKGLVFQVHDVGDPTTTEFVFSTEPTNEYSIPRGNPVTTPCPTYGIAGCIAPTKTPETMRLKSSVSSNPSVYATGLVD